MLSDKFIADVKKAVDLKALVEEYTELTPVGNGMWRGHCPHPDHEDSTPSFTLYKNKHGVESWCCYGCHEGKLIDPKTGKSKGESDCFSFIMWMSDFEGTRKKKRFPDAVKELARKHGIPIEEDKNDWQYADNKVLMKAYESNLVPRARQYLYDRGLDDEDITKWHIGFSSFKEKSSKKMVPRIVFPLMSQYGNVVGSSRRKLPEVTDELVPKYWNSPNSKIFNKSYFLYGMNMLTPESDLIYVTEGVMDVILAEKWGLSNVVAALSTSFTEQHLDLIIGTGKTPVLCMDRDSAGKKSTEKIVETMTRSGIYPKILILPDKLDLADLANIEKDNLLNYVSQNTQDYWQYVLEEPAKLFAKELENLKSKYLPNIRKALHGVEDDTENLLLRSFLKERFLICA